MLFSDSKDHIAGKQLKWGKQEVNGKRWKKWHKAVSKIVPNEQLTGLSVRRATNALDVKHTTEATAKPPTCMLYKQQNLLNRSRTVPIQVHKYLQHTTV